MVKIGVNGALGKMGRRILALAHEDPARFLIAGAFDIPDLDAVKKHSDIGIELGLGKNLGVPLYSLHEPERTNVSDCDVLVDFSGPDGADWAWGAALHFKKAVVIGSTGLSEKFENSIRVSSKTIPIS